MKYVILLALFTVMAHSSSGQGMSSDRHSVSGGLLGAINLSKLRLEGEIDRSINYRQRIGWSLGGYVSLPLGHALSLEPQVMYSLYDYDASSESPLLTSGKLSFLSVPVLVKLHLIDALAVTIGPQADFLLGIHETGPFVEEDDFESTTFSLSVGLEIFPREPLVIFGRYVHGFTDLDVNDPDNEYLNSNVQLGFKLRFFGESTPADTDGDGIIDREDDCPTVAGIAAFNGCPDSDNDGITDALDDCPLVAGIARYNGCPIPDTDKDGINDEVDKCPTVAGVAKYDGCPIPDTDGDGVNDDDDRCPTVAGLARYNGCPIPDTDGDGINDEVDKCPDVPGLAEFDGCPNPDRDNDGVPNAQDLCPDIPGPATNDGCPVVESAKFNARMINFVTGSAELTAQAKRDLREGASLLNSETFRNLRILIHGHTDSVGSNESNHTLSHKRADSVKAELVKNGVSADRITTAGFGEDRPIADNSTADGRALNRRVEVLARQ